MEAKKWMEMIKKYKIYLLAAAVVLIIGIVLAVSSSGKEAPEAVPEEDGQNQAQPEEAAEEPNVLEENSHASINRLVEKYCECIASGDVETLETIVDVLPEEEKVKIQERSAFIEAYENVSCYTKNGPVDDSYIVFVCFDMKLININTLAPDILCLYVSPKVDDKRVIHYGEIDESIQAYVVELEQDPEVQALYDDVRTRYQEALESDEMLAEFILRISGQVEEEVPAEEPPAEEGAEEAPEEAPEEEAVEEEETPAEEEAPTEENASEAAVQNRETRVKESVNVRAEASTDSERLALAYPGDAITQIESYENGWSKVEYKGQTGYVMTEYLE